MKFVATSITGKNWYLHNTSAEEANKISKINSISPVISSILLNRGISLKDISAFTNPKLKDLMPDPSLLNDLDKGVQLLVQHISNKSKILFLSDYDVDGITSLACFSKYLNLCQIKFQHYIPNRFKEGYGLNANSVTAVLNLNPDLLVLLDNGSGSYNEIEALRKQGIDVIIIDHHTLEITTPMANAIINPKSFADTSNLSYLCTVGLVFLFLVALNNSLVKHNIIKQKIELIQFLDLVTLGTVADMVPLISLNRAYTKYGIALLQKGNNFGLSCLVNLVSLDKVIDFDTIGFYLAPLINAGSRMGNSYISYNLLMAEDKDTANKLANEMIALNKERQQHEDVVINQAILEIQSNEIILNNNIIIVGNKKWSAGTIGIIAGRIKESYNKPTCVFALENDIATASGRSIDGVDLGELVIAAKSRGLLIKGGGHSQAVGFSFNFSKIDEIQDFFNQQIEKKYLKQNNAEQIILVDQALPINSISISTAYDLEKLAPFGINFKEPLFLLENVKISKITQIGEHKNHISCLVSDGFKFYLKAFAFKSLPGTLGESLLKLDNQFVNLVVSIKANIYQGKEYINLVIKDIGR